MAETTTNETEMTRAEAAAFLRSIADQLDSERGVVSVPVGNKHVELSPPGSIDSKATVTERSRRFRKDVEELALTFRWRPTKGAAKPGAAESGTPESGTDGSDAGSTSETDPVPGSDGGAGSEPEREGDP